MTWIMKFRPPVCKGKVFQQASCEGYEQGIVWRIRIEVDSDKKLTEIRMVAAKGKGSRLIVQRGECGSSHLSCISTNQG